MAKIFITGSSDGLGSLAAKSLIEQGHEVVLHARNDARARDALERVPDAETVLIADLTSLDEIKELATKVNVLGPFDAIIHNAGVYNAQRMDLFTVNVLAPYILTCLIQKPGRLIYLSSGLHMHGLVSLDDLSFGSSYADSKLYLLMLCKAVARIWPDVFSNAVNPGWVPTKMGGTGAVDDLQKGFQTQVWLAISDDPAVKVSGRYFFHKKESNYLPIADDVDLQNKLLRKCEEMTGVRFPD